MTKFRTLLLMSAASALLAGCQTTGGSTCDGWRPIRPAAADVAVISGQLVTTILAHNEFGAKRCGWKK